MKLAADRDWAEKCQVSRIILETLVSISLVVINMISSRLSWLSFS